MRAAWTRFLLAAALLGVAAMRPVPAQVSLAGAAPAASAPARASDPLGRETPRKAVFGFSRAAQRGDYALAARYVQLSRRQQPDAEDLLRSLDELMDRHFLEPLSEISDAPEGRLDDGLPPDRERIGLLRVGEKTLPIDMVRVDDAGLRVWLISSDTLKSVPEFSALIRPWWLERTLPQFVSDWMPFGFSLLPPLVWLASILLPLAVLHLLLLALRALVAALPGASANRAGASLWLAKVHWPVVVIGTLCAHLVSVTSFGTTSLSFRFVYRRLLVVLLVAALAWGLQRLLGLLFARAARRLHGDRRSGARSLLMLGERLLKVLIVITAGLGMLAIAGLDIRAMLAGLGIVGFAVALGARKTVENILGGVMLLGDQAIAIGDECRVSGRQGKVEDITLRSVRIRTREQTLLSIPAGVLAGADIENFSSRGKLLALEILRLSHRTTSAQMRAVRAGIAEVLHSHPLVEQDTASIRLVGLGGPAVEFEFAAYLLTTDFKRFAGAREELLLQVAAVVEAADAAFAGPPGA